MRSFSAPFRTRFSLFSGVSDDMRVLKRSITEDIAQLLAVPFGSAARHSETPTSLCDVEFQLSLFWPELAEPKEQHSTALSSSPSLVREFELVEFLGDRA